VTTDPRSNVVTYTYAQGVPVAAACGADLESGECALGIIITGLSAAIICASATALVWLLRLGGGLPSWLPCMGCREPIALAYCNV